MLALVVEDDVISECFVEQGVSTSMLALVVEDDVISECFVSLGVCTSMLALVVDSSDNASFVFSRRSLSWIGSRGDGRGASSSANCWDIIGRVGGVGNKEEGKEERGGEGGGEANCWDTIW